MLKSAPAAEAGSADSAEPRPYCERLAAIVADIAKFLDKIKKDGQFFFFMCKIKILHDNVKAALDHAATGNMLAAMQALCEAAFTDAFKSKG